MKYPILAASFPIAFFLASLLVGVGEAAAQMAPVTVSSCNSAIVDASINPNGATTQAWFEWGTTQSLGNSTSQQTFSSPGTLTQTIAGLQPLTTYFIRTVAQNQFGTAQSQIVSFNTPACVTDTVNIPTVTTNPANAITQNFATLNGFASGNGAPADAWFEWGTTQSLGNTTPRQFVGASGSSFNHTLTNLSPNTTYFFRAVAQGTGAGNNQTVFGNILSFTTSPSGQIPTQVFVSTNQATGVSDTFAVLNGFVDPAGQTVTRWFEWGTNGNLGNTTVKLQQSGASVFSHTVSGLQPNTTYFFRAVAQNQFGQQFFGNILTFTTTGFKQPSVSLQAQTLLATNVGFTSARLNGLAIQSGSASSMSGYFEWGSTQSLGNATPTQFVGSAPTLAFFHSLFGLSPNTTYYYRAVVTDGINTARGNIVSFTTGTKTVVTPPSRTTVIIGTGKPALVTLSVDRNGACNFRSSSVEYVIAYKNISNKLLKDVAVRVVLPEELSFLDSSRGSYADNDRTVVIALGTLSPSEEGTIRVRGEVARNAVVGKTTVITAYLVNTDSATGAQEEVVAYSLNPICESGTDQGAALFFGGAGFLPDSLIEWLILILLIFALIALARYMYGVRRPSEPL